MKEETSKRITFKLIKDDKSNFTFKELYNLVDVIDDVFNRAYKENGIKDIESLKDLSPEITNINNGCIEVTALITSIVAGVTVDIISRIITAVHKKLKIVKEEQNNEKIVLMIPHNNSGGKKWNFYDNYYISKTIIKEYVVDKSNEDIDMFIKRSLSRLENEFGYESVRAKIQNTKQILNEKRINNTLKCSPLHNYSKEHETAFIQACKNNNIKIN